MKTLKTLTKIYLIIIIALLSIEFLELLNILDLGLSSKPSCCPSIGKRNNQSISDRLLEMGILISAILSTLYFVLHILEKTSIKNSFIISYLEKIKPFAKLFLAFGIILIGLVIIKSAFTFVIPNILQSDICAGVSCS